MIHVDFSKALSLCSITPRSQLNRKAEEPGEIALLGTLTEVTVVSDIVTF
jgi:hypothetical protein